MAKKDTKPDFETALETLESLVERMESGELSLEDSLSAFEQGIQLTKSCQKSLQEAEQRVKILIEQNGSEELQDFAAHTESEG
ncbi:MAG: exodeoxyribonuclease VII small subunit [Gammaproteobacteria bacterium]|nr:MAG: exodeoxyribonuclease VII small subunit [Gammaproteobacteria bacterium]